MEQRQLLTPETFNQAMISFRKQDVLSTPFERKERLEKLHTALKLGNTHKHKVRLQFLDLHEQSHELMASVWAVTEKYVVLKNSIMIPIDSVYDVDYV
jgi:hypothetical protein